MDYNAYALPTSGGVQYDYQDDGLGGLADDGLGTGYEAPQDNNPPALDSYMDDFFGGHEDAAAGAAPAGRAGEATGAAAADDASLPTEGAQGEDDPDLAAVLDEELFKPAGEASKSQQADEDSELTVDEAASSDAETARSREESQQPEDPVHAEEQKLNVRKQECYDAMTEAQRNRLEAYNRSNLQKNMKRALQALTGSSSVNDRLLHALGSVTKMFVGELVATARQIAACQGHSGALLPSHIRAAYQVLCDEGKVPHRGPSKPLKLH